MTFKDDREAVLFLESRGIKVDHGIIRLDLLAAFYDERGAALYLIREWDYVAMGPVEWVVVPRRPQKLN